MRPSLTIVALCGALLLTAMAGHASAQTSSVAGVVTDTSGAVLPGVVVEASSPALIERTRSVVTDERGEYKIIGLRPGTYSVSFTLPGFNVVRRDGIELTPEFTAPVNASLSVGNLQESVTVSTSTPLVDVQNVTQGEKISREVLDGVPTNKGMLAFAALTPAVVSPPNAQDVGGSQGELSVRMAIHGGKQSDQKLLQDGMRYNSTVGDGTGRTFLINPASAEAITVTLGSGGSAESSVGGVLVNLVPKDGGNVFSGYFFTNYTNSSLQSDNLTAALRSDGLQSVNGVHDIYDINGAFGGPVKQNNLWFFTAHRHWGRSIQIANQFVDATPGAPTFTPDQSRPDISPESNYSDNVRFTWQAKPTHKLSFSFDIQNNMPSAGAAGTAHEAISQQLWRPNNLTQVTWTHAASSRLLFEAGATAYYSNFPTVAQNGVTADTISILEQSTNFRYNARANPFRNQMNVSQTNERASVSYVTGSHNIKVGAFYEWGISDLTRYTNNSGTSYTFSGGVPISITENASVHTRSFLSPDLALYAQDQWTRSRLTFNYGVRFEYVREVGDAINGLANALVPATTYQGRNCIPCWKDLNVRLGGAYDVFGNGKTAIKASLGRYVAAATTGLADTYSPSASEVTSVTRSWSDTNKNFVPDCVLTNPALNGECGPISNVLFGQSVPSTTIDPAVIQGWGKRPYNWQFSLSVDRELMPGVLLNAGYYRTWYGNFTVIDNLSVTPNDYDPYCVTAPVDPRLPGGGGNQICGLYDINPLKFGQVNNYLTFASNFGSQTEIYNGADVNFSVRLPRHVLLSGGLNIGDAISTSASLGTTTSATSACFVVDSPQQLYQCEIQPPYQKRFKMFGTVPLVWSLQASANFQTLPGAPIGATFNATTAQIATTLGRPLAGNVRTAAVQLIQPASQYDGRINQLDVRLSRVFKLGRVSVEGLFDVYNVLNASSVEALNVTYGPNWMQPQQILDARLFKFGAQMRF